MATAALEGRVFTAAAVADAIGIDRDTVVDLLDEKLAASEPPLVVEVDPAVVHLDDGRTRLLWRYGFASQLDWHAARTRLATPEERAERAAALAGALRDLYGDHNRAAAATICALLRLAGDLDGANHFQRIANFGLERDLLRAQAERLLADEAAPRNWVAEQLLHAVAGLHDTDGPQAVLRYARRAAELAEDERLSIDARVMEADALLSLSAIDDAERLLAPLASGASLAPSRMIRFGRIMGEFFLRRNDFPAAREWAGRALTQAIAAGNLNAEANLRCVLTRVERRAGDLAEARRHAERWLHCTRVVGDLDDEGYAAYEVAMLDWSDDRQAAREGFKFALHAAQETSKPVIEAIVRSALGALATEEGDLGEGLAQLERALELHLRTGDERFEGVTRYRLAEALAAQGHRGQARDEVELALPKLSASGDVSVEKNARDLAARLGLPV